MGLKLNIGDGGYHAQGYIGVDIQRGQDATRLDWLHPDIGPIEEIRASHVLEHFPHGQILNVLREWVRALKPGGVLKIAVPDFKMIAEQYLAGAPINIMGYIMGGQVDEHDYHKTLFDHEMLSETLRSVGLIGIRSWKDEIEDCSNLPISLNLCGTKPHEKWPSVVGVLSSPRLGFNDFWDCVTRELGPLMKFSRVTGAYWDHGLTEAIEESIIDHDPEWILTCDYDTVFSRDQIYTLLDLAMRHPEADAIAPLQTARHHEQPMFTVRGADGKLIPGMNRDELAKGEMLRCETAHFGLTLLRTSKLKAMPRPWFNRTYGEGGKDPDVQFWHNWKAAGNTLFTALRVPVGHCDLMVKWPGLNFEAVYQTTRQFHKDGPPEGAWR